MKNTKPKRVQKQVYDYLWITKRLLFLIEKNLLVIGEPVLKVQYCDEDYINETQLEAEDLLPTLTENVTMNFIRRLPTHPKDHNTFIDYACHTIEKLVAYKLKLDSNDCIEYFKIEYEKNHTN